MTADLKKIFDEYLENNPEFLQSLNAAPTVYEEEKAEQQKRASQLSGYQLLADSKQYGGNEDGQVNGQEDLAAKKIQEEDQKQIALVMSGVIGFSVLAANQNPNELSSENNSTIISSLFGNNQNQIG